ncbi:MAG: hemerythrin domain-containing protein [Antarcticimicrobium sp.]|uniref:bacteriohemerythrin n=1 Tax=Antarcticimicrobium sp. TaxID=2824147 RepID=UPI00261038EB|nr:hemerythrin domain-containing protein [Antarcticimicrobium sp.]MDF1717801.1 hemerythrin domain-containing protein [Antarcticimicrobium sp.]
MKWQPEFATGDAGIDDQHKMLFETSDQFRRTLEAGEGHRTYDLFLDFLTAYCEMHFSIEEKCMFARKCPVATQNHHEHGLFLRLVEKETARFREDGFDAGSATKLVDTIDSWMESHICRIDVRLREVLA